MIALSIVLINYIFVIVKNIALSVISTIALSVISTVALSVVESIALPVVNFRCSDYIRLYLDLVSAELPDFTECNYELCGNIASIPKQHYSFSRLLLIRFHSGSVQRNHTGFRGIYKFVNRGE